MMRTTFKPTKIAASDENACAAKIRTRRIIKDYSLEKSMMKMELVNNNEYYGNKLPYTVRQRVPMLYISV